MTCIEKLRELHPEWKNEDIAAVVEMRCPYEFMDIDDHPDCNCFYEPVCIKCWDRELEE